ncbi:MAG: hypothetical protein ChlgKO_07670 [Chlamydiales bacterium]
MADYLYATPHFDFSIEVNSALPAIVKSSSFDKISELILGATPHISSTTSAVSDVSGMTVSTLGDIVTVIDPGSKTQKMLVPIGELSFLSVMTSPISAYRHYDSMQKTEQVALRTISALGILVAGVKFFRGMAFMLRDVGVEIASSSAKTFSKAEKAIGGALSVLGLVYYTTLLASFGYKLSHQARFHYQLSKKSEGESKDFLIAEYRNDPKLLEMKVGSAAFRIFKEAIEGRDNKVVSIDSQGNEIRDIALGLGEIEKMVGSVKRLGRVEMLMRVLGMTASVLGILSIVLLIPLSGSAAVVVSLVLPILGSVLWVITDGFEVWNMLKDGEFKAKKVLALTLLFSSILVATNLIIAMGGPILSVAAVVAMVTAWFGFLGFMAYVHRRESIKVKEEQAVIKAEKSA